MTGMKIKQYLDSRGIRYSHISEKTGIPMNVLSPILNGKRKMSAEEYFKICKALNVNTGLFAEDEKGGQ